MFELIRSLYMLILARRGFFGLNRRLYRLALSSLGVLNYRNDYESGEARFILRNINGRNGVVLDVGANKGNYSQSILDASSDIRVFSFEPHPKTFAQLSDRFRENERVTLVNCGVSDTVGELELYDYNDADGSAHASIYQEVLTDLHDASATTVHRVAMQRLDDFLAANLIDSIILLKIDTEGNELAVLRGAENALKGGTIGMIHFEFNEMNVVSRVFFRDFWNLLNPLGYRFYRLLPDSAIEIPRYSPSECEIFAFQNIIATKTPIK